MSRDFGKNMPKHLAGYYLLNSYFKINFAAFFCCIGYGDGEI